MAYATTSTTSNNSSYYDDDIFEMNLEDNIPSSYVDYENTNNYTTTTTNIPALTSSRSTSIIASGNESSLPPSPLVLPQQMSTSPLQPYYSYTYNSSSSSSSSPYSTFANEDQDQHDDDQFLYECCICKQKLNNSNNNSHNCTRDLFNGNALNDNDLIIIENNKLIQNNYQKWLYNFTPNIPY
ncbi:conserved hypothetical protein [Candida dubliniensis CD36]|uniref:Uncharacterized protein n=1 Tax=Candida dubliniensis (strain CD36 / ATCC MYA-646 / CBS 7987 / NCPF 3949 / NRRL Y-17841) TaxID=573826 RepID=B9WDU4_CANDC|nr:conserved hypothetical protein [Candida dubliniensis CD36]CAX42851.1 conserved hypothetical protein [Candida dubliniensis CD36]